MSGGRTTKPERPAGPIERLLGPAAAAGGPFALLGLHAADVDDASVLASLRRQLERVDAHAEADSPAADEVRLALHASAAQLLDPVVRRHLVLHWSERGAPDESVPVRPAPPAFRAAPDQHALALEHDAVLLLARYGGVTRQSLRRLAVIAHARGVPADRLADSLHRLGRRRRPGGHGTQRALPAPTRPAPGRVRSTPAPAGASRPRDAALPGGATRDMPERSPPVQASAARSVLTVCLAAASLVALGLGAVYVLAVAMRTRDAGSAERPDRGDRVASPAPAERAAGDPIEPDRGAPAPAAPSSPAPRPPVVVLIEPVLVGREISACAQLLRTDRARALSRFSVAVQSLAEGWVALAAEPDRLVAAHDALIEFVYRASADGATAAESARQVRALGAALSGAGAPEPGGIVRAVWATGMLARLSRERDLPAACAREIEDGLVELLGEARSGVEPSFAAGAAAALQRVPGLLIAAGETGGASEERLRAWLRAVRAVWPTDARERDRVLIAAMETLLVRGAEPHEDRGVFDAIRLLTEELSWRADGEARRRLLRWFDDRAVSVSDLSALTSALATRSSASGVDVTMVLSAGAGATERADLRRRYAELWHLSPSQDSGSFRALWIEAASGVLSGADTPRSPIEWLAHAAILSRLNEAAEWAWRGEMKEAAAIVAALEQPIESALSAPGSGGTSTAPLDSGHGDWARRYLSARGNVGARTDLLNELGRVSSELGAVDAEVLAAEAFSGTPAEVRALAQQVLRAHANDASVVNAALELLPRMPRTVPNAQLVEAIANADICSPRDPDWPLQSRRALVERLLEVLSQADTLASTDRVARVLSESYRSRAHPRPLLAEERPSAGRWPAEVSASGVFDLWREEAGRAILSPRAALTLDEVDRRRAGRARLADGQVQAFAAQQVSVCDAMGVVVMAEEPHRADSVMGILDGLAARRRSATHIFEQIAAVERAMTALWFIRMGEEDPA